MRVCIYASACAYARTYSHLAERRLGRVPLEHPQRLVGVAQKHIYLRPQRENEREREKERKREKKRAREREQQSTCVRTHSPLLPLALACSLSLSLPALLRLSLARPSFAIVPISIPLCAVAGDPHGRACTHFTLRPSRIRAATTARIRRASSSGGSRGRGGRREAPLRSDGRPFSGPSVITHGVPGVGGSGAGGPTSVGRKYCELTRTRTLPVPVS
jgi:hypothetical protein